ncbi:MAG TPA: RDD family protein [Acidimicrobiales bacterium]
MNIGERLLGAVISPVVGAVDVDQVVSRVDVERVLDEIDVDALLQRVDLDAVLARVDIDALLQRVDIQALLERLDIDEIAARVDIQAVVDRVDVQAVVDRVDIDAVASRLDVAALAGRAGIDDIVADATRGVSTRILALVRRQLVALDLIVNGIWARFTRRARPEPPTSHSATGLVAGPVSRLLAYFVDVAVLSAGFAVVTAILTYLVALFSGDNYDVSTDSKGLGWGLGFTGGYVLFAFLYWFIGLSIAGSSIGKALIGVRVLRLDGTPIKGRQALVRVLVYPFSFILGLGLIPIVTARSHRALHDKAASTTVRYDWGDDTTTTRAPLTAWLRAKGPRQWEIDDSATRSQHDALAAISPDE